MMLPILLHIRKLRLWSDQGICWKHMARSVSELETEARSASFQRPYLPPLPSYLQPLPLPSPSISDITRMKLAPLGFPCRSPLIPQNNFISDAETLTPLSGLLKNIAADHRFKSKAFVIRALGTKPTSASQGYLDRVSTTKTKAKFENDRGLSNNSIKKK